MDVFYKSKLAQVIDFGLLSENKERGREGKQSVSKCMKANNLQVKDHMHVSSSELDALCKLIFQQTKYLAVQSCTFLQVLKFGIDLIMR